MRNQTWWREGGKEITNIPYQHHFELGEDQDAVSTFLQLGKELIKEHQLARAFPQEVSVSCELLPNALIVLADVRLHPPH